MEKPFYLSTTIQGQIVAALGLIVQLFDLPVLSEEIQPTVAAVLTLIGIGVSIYGRIKTKGEKLS